ncbi:hypothetical protein GcM1_224048 [Golovinomyces cichoracearum]|uniref:Uncharacterized protein n=1 Tax=Golovinomyces cichoracearum TaxID=62708 RepID=A0A420IQQ2_9PEZI|nr:hypothetical protein GcM1_224048 [Golovinomyces cichoracearum]
MCPSYPNSTWENGPDGIPLYHPTEDCIKWTFFIRLNVSFDVVAYANNRLQIEPTTHPTPTECGR